MNTNNKEKLQKRFDELCELISEGKLIEHDPKMGMIRDARTLGGALNELKLIEKALDLCDGLEENSNINITVNMSCDNKVDVQQFSKELVSILTSELPRHRVRV